MELSTQSAKSFKVLTKNMSKHQVEALRLKLWLQRQEYRLQKSRSRPTFRSNIK